MPYDPRFSREAMQRQAAYTRWMRECDKAHHDFQRKQAQRNTRQNDD